MEHSKPTEPVIPPMGEPVTVETKYQLEFSSPPYANLGRDWRPVGYPMALPQAAHRWMAEQVKDDFLGLSYRLVEVTTISRVICGPVEVDHG